MINNADANSTPKRSAKRSSAEYMRAMASPTTLHDTDIESPETPSPPRNGRRSSASLGFLASPLHPRAEAALGKSGAHESAFIIPQSPRGKSRLLPPTTPKSRNAEVFLSPSPKLKSPNIQKENGKPIREISNGLKARLNYALVKLQNGWVDKTLSELEQELENPKHSKRHSLEAVEENAFTNGGPSGLTSALLKGSSYNNEFLSTESQSDVKEDLETAEDDDNSNSAHIAFLKALSSPKRKTSQDTSASPLRWSKQKAPVNALKKNKDQPSEVEAIETLMSLSSPQRPRSTQDFTLPVPPKISRVKAPVISPASSTSSASPDPLGNNKSAREREDFDSMIIPIMQKQSSESSAESLQKSLHAETTVPLEYDQQQTDIETDVEVSENEQHV
ncbi:hypothetical protein HG535_0F05920 [Zygotorulaspora mrakii]|uniref:Uncharacterized protein n=1 Tax=Zygotorulaspora mrakii TaxID=42260 RepID=A0A7H9B6B5_ZYGMR|nr:uncharacterized protein HG535_0F05920 [Zygotorulaspora mrakii]QLG74080.1 hypothetical protein HG535_0F05920 [Zygotorulaspora mrakii]